MTANNTELLGVLGGMGPYTDVYFLNKLISLNKNAVRDQDYPRVALYSNTQVPCRVKSYPHSKDAVICEIVKGFEFLEKMRVTLGVITCNTAHIYFEEIESKVKYPLISIVEQTKNELAQSHYSSSASIGILATDATIKFDLYGKPLNTVGISTIYPNNGEQELVSKAIFDPRIGIKSTAPHISRDSSNYLAFVMKQMNQRHGVETFLAGCTELSIACSHALASEFKIIDPLEILARSCLAKLNFSEGAPNNIESQRKFA